MSERDAIPDQEDVGRLISAGNLAQAEQTALRLPIEWQSAEGLAEVARAYDATGDAHEASRIRMRAIEIARAGEWDIDCSSVLWEIAEDLALAGDMSWAEDVANRIVHQLKRRNAKRFLEDIEKGGKGSFYFIREGRESEISRNHESD